MTTAEMVLAIILVVLALALSIVILLQKGREADAGAVTGGSAGGSNYEKTAGHQKDTMLGNMTKILGVVFFLVAIATVLVTAFA